MKQAIQQISEPVKAAIEQFKTAYQAALQSDNALIRQMVDHVNQSSGKQMRPLLVLLCAQLYGDITPATLHAAASIELLHVASLIHDDVVIQLKADHLGDVDGKTIGGIVRAPIQSQSVYGGF